MTSSSTSAPAAGTRDRSLIQLAALVVGATFLLVGVLGFLPGVTTDYDSLSGAGTESTAKLLGIFQVSVLHNVVHLLFGIAGLADGPYRCWRPHLPLGGGVIYLVLWIYGLLIDKASNANFIPFNTADNWLHFALGVAMLGPRRRARQEGLARSHVPGRKPCLARVCAGGDGHTTFSHHVWRSHALDPSPNGHRNDGRPRESARRRGCPRPLRRSRPARGLRRHVRRAGRGRRC